jgi:hypothetical protein
MNAMKHLPLTSRLHGAALALLLSTTGPALAGWQSARFESKREVFLFADRNNDGNIDPGERDQLRASFASRGDLHILDSNLNGKLDKQEIDALEQGFKTRKADKKKEKKSKELQKKLEKRWKKNR